MASSSPTESSYFPSLGKCLNGEEILISWKTVFTVIHHHIEGTAEKEPAIERFLSDTTVRQLLSHPFDESKATPQSKSLFETKTSAINVTPSSDARFDINQVKADAGWLSSVGGFDEVSALRIVVQECQARASAKLLGPFSEEELTSIRESAGDSKFSSPVTATLLSRGADPVEIQAQFDTEDNRRQRILSIYLSERRYFLKCLERLLHAVSKKNAHDEGEAGKGKQTAVAHTWLEACGRDILAAMGPTEAFFLLCLNAIEKNVRNIGAGSGWYDGARPEIEADWVRTQLTEATHTLELLAQMIFSDAQFPTSQLTLGWFRLLQSCEFFNSFSTEQSSLQTLVLPLQSLTMVISLLVLSVGSTLQYLLKPDQNAVVSATGDPSGPFILDINTLSELHQIMMNAADQGYTTAGPPILAWVSILKAIGDDDPEPQGDGETLSAPNPYADLVNTVQDSMEGDDPIDYLARRCVNQSRVLETLSGLSLRLGSTPDAFFSTDSGAIMRNVVLDLIGSSNSGLGYIPEAMEALLSTLRGGQNYWDLVDSKQSVEAFDPIATFISNDVLIDAFFKTAMSRYPCEPLPFLQLIHAVASCGSTYQGDNMKSAVDWLNIIPYFTYRLPENFVGYETAQEEDNNNTIRLRTAVHLFQGRSKFSHQRVQSESMALTLADPDFCIPAGTFGRVISDSGPRVVFWYHQYSGLKYLGKLLETFLTASDLVDATTGSPVDRDSVVEIIEILATILHNTLKSGASNPDAKEDAQNVLELASSGLSRNRDIITVVFDIFEEELQRQSTVSGSEVPLGILVSCVHFMHSLLPFTPGRVWPLLARSGLLGVSRGGGRLSTIVEGVELVSGRYEFLLSCIRLYEALVDDIACNAIRRRSGPQSSGRFQSQEDVGTGIPDHLLSKVLLFFTRYLIDVLESSFGWKFITQNDRRRLSKVIATIFDNILRYVYGIEGSSKDTQEEEKTGKSGSLELQLASRMTPQKTSLSKTTGELASKITGVLIPSASQIVDSFLATSSSSLRFQPILVSFLDALETPDLTNFSNELRLWTSQGTAVLSFSTTLLRVSNMIQKPPTEFEHQMFKAAPLIARLYAVSDSYKRHVVSLFEALVVTANNVSEPPSLLGHLGPHTAKNFLHILSDLDKPLVRNEITVSIWHFLSMVVSNKQQWFANYLLTGKTPRESVAKDQAGKQPSALDKPLLTTALENLIKIDTLPQFEALAMLEFISLSQNFWPWTVYGSSKHGEFITAISEYVGTLTPIPTHPNLAQSIDAFYQTKIAAYVAEILAMHLFHSRQTGSTPSITNLIANLSYYIRFGTAVPSFNSSLHTQLAQIFATRHPNCTIHDLKRTTLEERQLGKDYFYDLSLAEKMLQFHPGWSRTTNDGLRVEFETANVNLSLVDAQIALFHGWKVLALELTSSLASNIELQEALIKVSLDSLTSNCRSQRSEEIFTRLCYQRADFALILTQRLTEAKCALPQINNLLEKTWHTIRNFRGTFEQSIRQEDAPYYRSLLKLLFVAARAHAASPGTIPSESEDFSVSVRMKDSMPVVSVVLDIIKYVVAIGLREFVAAIHDEESDPLPEDIALITGILQSCLRIPGIDFAQTKIISIFRDNGTARVATTLFSWSDSIAIDGDPIYGELSMLFLLELSTLPLMAEQLAMNGILGQLASANISTYLRSGKVSPFADGPGLQRCYSIWTRGILPFLLNLLDAVQVSIATEVALFLNQFTPLLAQCSEAFEAPESSRTSVKGPPKYICLSMCSEAHSLALINYILEGFRGQAEGSVDVPALNWDAEGMAGNVEWWLGAKMVLRERIVPMGRRDEELRGRKGEVTGLGTGGVGGSRLEQKVLVELMGIRDVLGGGEDV
ncbi:hypothetical protein HYFRA_00014005 [Hymenoscyphus fraxineus]|uniref:Nucleoporin NUP188 n=1 Tax=Hymenoscyphus fraxineus TaxID=746836 RepID=A0A9N9L9A5_9HELO|nr:hypothetical protein HYFRA_00014005 [Hymenoscyphus fraxineus]